MALLDYGEILRYLAKNPPQMAAERQLHASLLELLAKCLLMEERVVEIEERYPAQRGPSAYRRSPRPHWQLDEYQHLQERRPLQRGALPQYPQAPRTSAGWGA